MRPRHRAWRTAWLTITLIGLLLTGCKVALLPLDQQLPEAPLEAEAPEVILVRVATCWAGQPLAEALIATHTTDQALLSFDLTTSSSRIARDALDAGQAELAIVGPSLGTPDGVPSTPGIDPPQELALDALALIVHPSLALHGITRENLVEVYAGRVLEWESLGGAAGRPAPISLSGDSYGRALFQRVVMGKEAISSATILMPHDRAVVEYVAAHPEAIGYVSRAHVDERVRMLALDGVEPTVANLKRGAYPLTYSLYLLRAPGASGAATRLATFATASRARGLIEARYVAVR